VTKRLAVILPGLSGSTPLFVFSEAKNRARQREYPQHCPAANQAIDPRSLNFARSKRQRTAIADF